MKEETMSTSKIPNTNFISSTKIEQVADSVRLYDDSTAISSDVTRIAKKLGLEVYEVEFESPDISGMIKTEAGNTIIYVNRNDNEGRKRFTIAHEIGHFILHHKVVESEGIVDFRQSTKNYTSEAELVRETQANMFAAALLLPKGEVKRAWDQIHDIEEVAKIFHVSKKALVIRLDNLGLL